MPKARMAHTEPSERTGTVWFVSCSCGWTCSRRYQDEAHAAADAHALRHKPSPPTSRPSW